MGETRPAGIHILKTGEGEVHLECVGLNSPLEALGLLELAKSLVLKQMEAPQEPKSRVVVPLVRLDA